MVGEELKRKIRRGFQEKAHYVSCFLVCVCVCLSIFDTGSVCPSVFDTGSHVALTSFKLSS